MTDTKRYITATIYRGTFRDTLAILKDCTEVFVEHPRGNHKEDELENLGYPVVELVRREIWNELHTEQNGYVHAKPAGLPVHSMASGSFIYSSDSRFRELNQYPIPLHDRVEN